MTMTVAQAVERLFDNTALRVTAFDGSSTGPADGWPVRIASERGLSYLFTAPGSLGLARAYLQDELVFEGVNEGDPYDLLATLEDGLVPRGLEWRGIPELARFVAAQRWRIPELPREETPSRMRRLASGLAHGRRRDAEAIAHHYDVSNRFYELVLGPSMAYTCAAYPSAEATLEAAQEAKFDLVCRKLGLEPGMRLLDVGCGWGGMVAHAVRHYGVSALGVTLSKQQAAYAVARLEREGLADRAQVRHQDYRDVSEEGFDAVSSIGLTEHIGPRNYPAYFGFLRGKLIDGGRLLNHCITRTDPKQRTYTRNGFINRYIFPDGELVHVGVLIDAMENQHLEVQHEENLRIHYAMTLACWLENLEAHWDEAVAEVGLRKARVWRLYLAASQWGFARNQIQLHQVLVTRTAADGDTGLPLRLSLER